MVQPFVFSAAAFSFYMMLVYVFVAILQNVGQHSTESLLRFSHTLLFLKAEDFVYPAY